MTEKYLLVHEQGQSQDLEKFSQEMTSPLQDLWKVMN